MESSYQQEALASGRVRFTVTPAPVPRASGAPAVLAGIFVLMVLATITRSTLGVLMLIRLAVAITGAIWIHRFTHRWFARRIDKIRCPGGTFVVSPATIEGPDGSPILRSQLHRLIVRNGIPDAGEPAVVDTGSVGSGVRAGVRTDRAVNRAGAATVSYMLCAEAGDHSTTLAGGMTVDTAHGLLTDVSRILRLA